MAVDRLEPGRTHLAVQGMEVETAHPHALAAPREGDHARPLELLEQAAHARRLLLEAGRDRFDLGLPVEVRLEAGKERGPRVLEDDFILQAADEDFPVPARDAGVAPQLRQILGGWRLGAPRVRHHLRRSVGGGDAQVLEGRLDVVVLLEGEADHLRPRRRALDDLLPERMAVDRLEPGRTHLRWAPPPISECHTARRPCRNRDCRCGDRWWSPPAPLSRWNRRARPAARPGA